MRMSRKELEKRVEELEGAVRSLCQMHEYNFGTMAAGARWVTGNTHPKTKVDWVRHPASTSYGEVSFEELAQFVVDGKPLEFKEKDKELVTEVYPDGKVLKRVVDKEKKTKYIAPYKIKDTTSWVVEMRRAMKDAGVF